jgi:hypothetical protein
MIQLQSVVLGVLIAATSPVVPQAAAEPKPRVTLAEAEARLRDVSAAVEKLRGLKFKRPVPMRIVDSAEARADFRAKIDVRSEAQARHTGAAYLQLGLIPQGKGLIEEYLDLTDKEMLGYYDHDTKSFVLLSHVSAEEAETVMAHELTHALEDQYFDLDAMARKAGSDDQATAIRAVVEGSATAVMIAYFSKTGREERAKEAVKQGDARRAQVLRTAPSFTKRSLMLPYLLGFTFLLRGEPWKWHLDGMAVDDIATAYAHPPLSTRQILHPEQYWVGRTPPPAAALELPDLSRTLGAGWSRATSGSIGELGLAVLTGAPLDFASPEIMLPARWTNPAATGIVADLFQHYVSGDRRVTVLVTRFETDGDAREFDEALGSRGKHVFRSGVNVCFVAGDAGDKADALATAALQGLR